MALDKIRLEKLVARSKAHRFAAALIVGCFLSSLLACFAAKSAADTYLEYLSVVAKTNSWAEANQFNLEPPGPLKPIDGSMEKSEQSILTLTKFSTPYTARVISETTSGDKATLVIQGFCKNGTPGGKDCPCNGKVSMVKVGDAWKIAHQELHIDVPSREESKSMAGKTGTATIRMAGQTLGIVDAKVNSKRLLLKTEKIGGTGPFSNFPKVSVYIDFRSPISLDGQSYSGDSFVNNTLCTVNQATSSTANPKFTALRNYNLALRFYKQQGDLLPGFIDLKATNQGCSAKGFFYAKRIADSASVH